MKHLLPIAFAAATALLIFLAMSPARAASAAGDCRWGTECSVSGDGAYTGMSEQKTRQLPRQGKARVKEKGKAAVKTVPYEYSTPLACPSNVAETENEVGCEKAYKECVDVKNAVGPLVSVFQRLAMPKGQEKPWTKVGETCWPNLVPNAKQRPRLTVAMINAAFAQTPFVKPQVSVQPVGNKTLVNLPTYFAADFSGPGYGPDQVRTVTLLGHKVQIKPVLKSNTFHYGDGSSFGPTTSRGGTYPDGDVKHTYLKRGTVATSITTVYGGQFAVDGGDFTDLPGTATVTGPVQQLQILEATDHLIR